jgi:hypothetical protein
MSNIRYLEVDSTYRDRNRFPNPGEFEIPISQTGRKDAKTAIDPVSLGAPIISWTSNNLSTTTPFISKLVCTLEPKTTALSGSSNTQNFIINSINRLHQLNNYYEGLIVEDAAFYNRRRIVSYIFLGSFGGFDRAEISVDSNFPETLVPGNTLNIYDPTDLSNNQYPIFWVPAARNLEDQYINFLIYNETLNDYRKIVYYNNTTHTILVETTETNVLPPEWTQYDNYSIRKENPLVPVQYHANPTITSATLSTITISSNHNEIDSTKFVRVVPLVYNYNLPGSDNECRKITSYDSTTHTITVYPNFSEIPTTGLNIEILNFSFDNLNPFVYTGSLTSQQELVCYEVELLSLLLPTETLTVANGGVISYYPYVYVELSNTCSSNRNIIYSNNPHSTKSIFRAPIFDVQDNPVFTKVGGGMSQTIKFKPNDTLYFAVRLPNGEVFQNIVPERYSPLSPEPRIQISAMFSMRRLV